ncbi:MAG TPA: M28 family peptidase [Acidimicrobiales bacterium]|nr:M28 family peptidase [Acidimicrobiales bacterium]
MDRRAFMAGMVATATAAAAATALDPAPASAAPATPAAVAAVPALPNGLADAAVPGKDEIFGWIEQIFAQGVRRPGYPADVWTEQFARDRFAAFGLENVRLEPITVRRWRSNGATLQVTPGLGAPRTIACFPVPFSAPVTNLELDLAGYLLATPTLVKGKAALYDLALLRLPATTFAALGSAPPLELTSRIVDPSGGLLLETHLLPFGLDIDKVMEPVIAGGAKAFIGNLANYPGNGHDYFVPYDGIDRPIPGVWIGSDDGAWLHQKLLLGGAKVRLTVDSVVEEVTSHNVVGELPGLDDEQVIIGSHHDGPWASAVEDASGTAMVLAQARFWAAQPVEKRPHRLVFLLHGGHMSGGAGLLQYIEAHRDELADVVLETHLEHIALSYEEKLDGSLASTGKCVPRWWFTSRNPQLEGIVKAALTAEQVDRSLLLAPNAIGDNPPTDGAFYHREGVPIVQHMAAPWYLFDQRDTLDKVDRSSLVGVTRATIRIVDATRGISAAAMRAGVVA